MNATDLELLARYTREKAEDAFAEIVRRHLDLVLPEQPSSPPQLPPKLSP